MDFLEGFLEYASDLESPTQYNVWSGIICAASVLSRKVWIPSGYDGIHPCLYIFFVGPIGIGKDQAARLGADMLIKNVMPDALGIEVTTKARFYQLLKQKEQSFTWEDGLVYSYSPATIFSSELESLTSADDEFFESLIDLWNKRTFCYQTVAHGGINIERPGINFIGNTNPYSFEKFMQSGHISQGMGRRFITIFCTKRAQIKTILQDYSEPHKEAQCFKLRHQLAAMHMYRGPFQMSPGFLHLVDLDNHENIRKAENNEYETEHLRAYFVDRKIFLFKLGMILATCRAVSDVHDATTLERHKEVRMIEEIDFYKADKYLKEAEATLVELYKISSLNPDLKFETKVLSWLKKKGALPKEDIVKKLGKEIDIIHTEKVLASLSRKGQIMLNEGIVKIIKEEIE
jgi:hypothetical protein